MPKVFIVNEPDESRVPAGRASWDTSPAAFFGELVYVFTADNPPPVRDREAAFARAHEVLSQATPNDFLVWAGGDPFGMVIAAAVLADYTDGQFTYLMWDRMARSYAPVPVDLFPDNGEDEDE
ncbi:hypothetical protein Pan1_42 [Pseudanabaena phage Pan1]|nr:hypothetical protein Pan1_42 [Pseudanabaena phage Pan1]